MEEDADDKSSEKELVPRGWFEKPQDYRLFDYILDNIGFIIDDLKDKSRILALGASVSDGGNYKGAVRATGYFRAQDDLFCRGVSVIGRSNFRGLVIVDGDSMVLGRSTFENHTIFGGKTEIAGNAVFDTHILSSGKLILSGDVSVQGNVYSDSPITLKGKVGFTSLRSSSIIYATAQIRGSGEIYAEEFVLTKGGGEIGNITAKFVSIGFKDKITARRYHGKLGDRRNFINPIVLLKYIKNTLNHALFRPKGSRILIVNGDVKGEEVYLSNCVVKGNVKGNNIEIGPNVEIAGLIEYSDNLKITSKTENKYKSKQIEASEEN
ncbi:MAG: hypothetical protein GPJ54_15675 [Candidatus Heimdallarchaeota archaeon]|nr:hypothetical protein [Candidatus Heimdallarchaeota archaeon]